MRAPPSGGAPKPKPKPEAASDPARPPQKRRAPRCSKALGEGGQGGGRHADKSVFPGLLIAMVLCFFGVQSRIDRNDPKLGMSPIDGDPDLKFGPPPTRR